MKTTNKLAIASAAVFLTLLGGCASGPVSQSDRDTSGNYDGVWVGSVGGPRASNEILPGNWRMSCDWEPFEIYVVVDDGQLRLGRLEKRTAVSTKGRFRYDLESGFAQMTGGVMPGNSKFKYIYSGTLAGGKPSGKYMQTIPTIANTGCSSKIKFRRYTEQEA